MVGFEEMRGELLERIEDLLKRKQYTALRDLLSDLAPADIASLFEDLDEDSIPLLFRLLPKEPAAEVFVELDPDAQEMLIRGFSNTELKEVLDELYLDDAVDIVEEMPANVVKRILKHADPDTRKSINEILKYPDDSAGALMTTEFVDLKRDMTVEDALKRIRRTGTDKETINVCYVVDPARKLQGIVSLRTILLSDEDDTIDEIMETHVISVSTLEDKEDVAQTFSKYNFIALPVVDKEDRLVGIITIDDDELVDAFLDVMEKHKMVVENSGLLSVAALRHLSCQGLNVVCVLSGGNMDVITMASLVQHGLIMRGRIFTFSVLLPDRPGALLSIADILARENGNVIKLEHNQFVNINRQSGVELKVTLEAFGHDHKDRILEALSQAGYQAHEVDTTDFYH